MKVQILWKDHAWEENQLWGKRLLPCVFIMNGGEWLEGGIITNKTLPIPSHCSIKLASTAGSRASSKMETIPFFSFLLHKHVFIVWCATTCVWRSGVSLFYHVSLRNQTQVRFGSLYIYALSHPGGAISVVEDNLFNSGRPATHANLLPQLPKCCDNRHRAGTSGDR